MSITTRAAVCRVPGQPWEITELELDDPKANEVRIKFFAAGLCHSDDHIQKGDAPMRMPVVEMPVSFSLAVMLPRFKTLKLRPAVSESKEPSVIEDTFPPTDGAMITAGAFEELVTRPIAVEPSL